jgi:hypothetical protein
MDSKGKDKQGRENDESESYANLFRLMQKHISVHLSHSF